MSQKFGPTINASPVQHRTSYISHDGTQKRSSLKKGSRGSRRSLSHYEGNGLDLHACNEIPHAGRERCGTPEKANLDPAGNFVKIYHDMNALTGQRNDKTLFVADG